MSWMLGQMIVLGFTLLLWKINIDVGSNLFQFGEIFTYYIVGNIFLVDNSVHYGVSEKIKNGRISTSLLLPSNFFGLYFFGDMGWRGFA